MRLVSSQTSSVVFFVLLTLLSTLNIHCGGGSSSTPTPALSAPSGLVYPHPTLVATVGQALPANQPTVNGSPAAFAVAPALPAGISLNATNGAIAGTPTTPSSATTYTVTASNTVGSTSTTLLITVNAASTVTYQILNCGLQIQEHSQWCWAASGASILPFLGNPQSQCSIVNYVRGITYACGNTTFNWADTAANSPIEHLYGSAPSVQDFMAHYGKPCSGRSSAISYAEIQSEIGANRPFYINWSWPAGGGHILVGFGWDTRNGGQEVTIMDPWPNEGLKTVAYTWACSGSDPGEAGGTHTWQWTLTINP